MKKWYNEEYEFEIEVTGFLRGDHTEHYCRNGEEVGDQYTCTYGCPVNKDGQGICSKTMMMLDCQHFFRQIFLGYFSDIVQAFDTLRKNVCGDDYTSLHNPIVLSSVLPAYGMFHSIQILFL